MGAFKWGLKATLGKFRTIVHNCALSWPSWAPFLGEFSSQNDDNRRQSCTIVDKYLKPPFARPPFRLSQIVPQRLKFSNVTEDVKRD